MSLRVAFINVHSSPLAKIGGRDTGGMNIYIRDLSRELGKRGVVIDIFTRCNGSSAPRIVSLGENVRVIHLRSGEVAEVEKDRMFPLLPEFLSNLRRFAEDEGASYGIFHSHYWLSAWVGEALRRVLGAPHIAMFHTLGEVKNQARAGENETELRIETERNVVAGADYLVAASADERNQLVRLYGASPSRVEVIACGVDLSRFHPMNKGEARSRLGFPERQIVLFVGRIEPLKGLDLLLETVEKLEDKSDLRVLVIGGDSHSEVEIERLHRTAAALGICEKVSFLGAVEHDRLPVYYNAANVCVVPSYYESFGMAALEAQACGTPVIASRVGGLDDVVQDGETGYLIPWHCPEPFAERLELLLSNETLQRALGKAGHAFAKNFAWETIADRIMALYEKALAPVNRGAP